MKNRQPKPVIERSIAAAIVLALALSGNPAWSERRHHDSHEHGVSVMNVVIEAGIVAVELTGPMVNFVGFENAPADEEETRLLENARVQLERPDELLRLDADAACSLRSASVTAPEAGHRNDDMTAGPSGRESGPGEHDNDHRDAGRGRETHREISGIYEFACSRPEHLSRIQVRIFDAFPDTEEIEVNLLGRSSDSYAIVRPDSTELKLRD